MTPQYRADLDLGEDSTPPMQTAPVQNSRTVTQHAGIFMAGFLAGGLSRTTTAPLERMKTLFQTGKFPNSARFGPALAETIRTQVRMCAVSFIAAACPDWLVKRDVWLFDQGVLSLWRGNLTNCLKVAPSKAVKFVMFESVRKALSVGRPLF